MRGRRRAVFGGLAALVVLLAAAAGLGAHLAIANKHRADRWQARAAALERNAKVLNDLLVERTSILNGRTSQLNGLAAKVAESQHALSLSEGDVQGLEQRQRQLANEKAQLEDQRSALEQQQGALTTVAGDYVRCKSDLERALQAVSAKDQAWLDANGNIVQADCAQADSALQDFVAAYGRSQ